MNRKLHACLYLLTSCLTCLANEVTEREANTGKTASKSIAQALQQHGEKSQLLAIEQDELSADVQDLIDEQTDAEVIGLLREIEVVMADATDLLEQKNTSGETIATETEVIEKIFEAAKKKQQNQQEGGG